MHSKKAIHLLYDSLYHFRHSCQANKEYYFGLKAAFLPSGRNSYLRTKLGFDMTSKMHETIMHKMHINLIGLIYTIAKYMLFLLTNSNL